MMHGVDRAAWDVARALDELGARHAIMGGLAVRIHGIPRPTFDVDFTAELSRDRLVEFYDQLEDQGYSIPDIQRTGWVDTVQGMPVVKVHSQVGEHTIDVDLFLAESPFQVELLGRRVRVSTSEWAGWFVTPEDLILLKLIADRPKDRIDVADTIFIQGRLDEGYLRKWAKTLGVLSRLESALSASNA